MDLLQGTTTPEYKQLLWCTLGDVVLLDFLLYTSLELLGQNKSQTWNRIGCPLHPPTSFSLSCSHVTCAHGWHPSPLLRHALRSHLRPHPGDAHTLPCCPWQGRHEGPRELPPCPLPSRLVPSLYEDQSAENSPTPLPCRLRAPGPSGIAGTLVPRRHSVRGNAGRLAGAWCQGATLAPPLEVEPAVSTPSSSPKLPG